MLPTTEFNFVVAGLATFAATVGYTATRRLSGRWSRPSSSSLEQGSGSSETEKTASDRSAEENGPSGSTAPIQVNPQATLTRQDSLKRKAPHDGFEDHTKDTAGYPHNLDNLYPNKRSRTPPAASKVEHPVQVRLAPAPTLDIVTSTPDDDKAMPLETQTQEPQSVVATPAPEPPRTPSPITEQPTPFNPPSPTPAPASLPSTPQPVFAVPTIPRPTTPRPFASSKGGFAAFAGSTSPFAAVNKPQPSPIPQSRSIWAVKDVPSSKADELENEPPLGTALGEKPQSTTESKQAEKSAALTGEEDESVELELKGVKLFVKRGKKPFVDGLQGHVKLLSHHTTSAKRILFRREPLWKVSMNVRVSPYVRCSYVPEENALKFVLKEPVESTSTPSDGQAVSEELVIYALKPGRACPKGEFKDFAEALVTHFTQDSTKSTDSTSTSCSS